MFKNKLKKVEFIIFCLKGCVAKKGIIELEKLIALLK